MLFHPKGHSLSTLVIAVLCAATLSFAEDLAEDSPFQALTPDAFRRATLLSLETSETDAQPNVPLEGIRVGKVRVLPRLDSTLTYSDNVLRSRRDVKSDFISQTLGTLGMNYTPSSSIRFDFSAAAGWVDYVSKTAIPHPNYALNMALDLRDVFVKGLEFGVSDRYYQTSNTDILENEFLAFTHYENNEMRAFSKYAFNRFAVTTTVKENAARYFDSKQRGNNFVTDTFDMEGAYTFVPERFVLFGDVQHGITTKHYQRHDDFDSDSFKAGVRGTYGKLDYSVAFGYAQARLTKAPRTTPNSADGMAFNAFISYKPQERLRFLINADRHFFPSPYLHFSTETDARVAMETRITQDTHFNLEAIRNENKVLGGDDVIRYGVKAGMEWKLNKPVVLSVGGSRVTVDNSHQSGRVVVHEVFVGFRLGW